MRQSIFFKTVGLGFTHTIITKRLSVSRNDHRSPPCISWHQSADDT